MLATEEKENSNRRERREGRLEISDFRLKEKKNSHRGHRDKRIQNVEFRIGC